MIQSGSVMELEHALAHAQAIERELLARRCESDCYTWLTEGTATRDEQDPENPNKPFPRWPYIKAMLGTFEAETLTFLEKSRTIMGTWTGCGFFAHKGFTSPQKRFVFQSADEARAMNCINYVKWLWENSLPELQKRWPLARPMEYQHSMRLTMANGTIFEAIVGGVDKIRSKHPTGYLLDEGAHVVDGADCLDVAMAANPLWVLVISSANPGWFQEATEFALPAAPPVSLPKGMMFRRTNRGNAVLRVHYSADPRKNAEWVEKEKRKYTRESNWNLEMEIRYDAKKGALVYPEFREDLHTIPDADIPEEGCIFMAADPHPRTPHAFLWVLIDAAQEWYVFRELWPSLVCGEPRDITDDDEEPLYTVKQYAEALAALEGNEIRWAGEGDEMWGDLVEKGEVIYDRFMDQAAKGFKISAEGTPFVSYWDRYKRYGFRFREPYKKHDAGEDKIRELLKPRRHEIKGEWPRLHIAESCRELILEFKKYRYEAKRDFLLKTQDVSQKGIDKRSHLLDCLRYIATSGVSYHHSFRTRRNVPFRMRRSDAA